MRFGFPFLCVAFVLLLCSSSPQASGAVDVRESRGGTPRGLGISVFQEGLVPANPPGLRLGETLRLSGTRIDGPTVSLSQLREGKSQGVSFRNGSKKRTAIAVICSALLPGLGELFLYSESRSNTTLARVPFFFALEGYLWYGYDRNYTKGKDYKHQYEAFADEHWSLDRFLAQHPCCSGVGGCDSWQFYNSLPTQTHCDFNFFIFTPREADREEYYENIGKYNAFVYGWDDWADQPDYWTRNRHEYVSLRNESDKYLLRADEHVMGLIVSRVVSIVDAAWIAHRMSRGQSGEEGWSLHLKTYDEAPCLIISRRF